jgi:microcystin degradation protein MlrC
MKIAIAELKQESNTFAPLTLMEDFINFHYYTGTEVIEKLGSAESEIAGFLEICSDNDFEVLPIMAAFAVSGGPLSSETFQKLTYELYQGIRDCGTVDGILLALHGAMITEEIADADGEILEKVREIVGPDIPMMVTMDLHANITKRKVNNANTISGFHTCPHTDLVETGRRAARMLALKLKGDLNPIMRFIKVPMVVPASNQIDFKPGPYAELINKTKSLIDLGAVDASAFTVQPWMDIPELGFGAIVVTNGDKLLANLLVSKLAQIMWESRVNLSAINLIEPETAVANGLSHDTGPVVLSDIADGTMAGSPGDSTAVLKVLLGMKISKTVLVSICDPKVAELAEKSGVGSKIKTLIGGIKGWNFYSPCEIEGEVLVSSEMKYRFTQKGYHGMEIKMGLCAVIAIGHIRLLVTSLAASTTDPAFYRAAGLNPEKAQIVIIKSHAQFQDSYSNIAKSIYFLNTPGMSSDRIAELPFTKIDRPTYPWDPGLVFGPPYQLVNGF